MKLIDYLVANVIASKYMFVVNVDRKWRMLVAILGMQFWISSDAESVVEEQCGVYDG